MRYPLLALALYLTGCGSPESSDGGCSFDGAQYVHSRLVREAEPTTDELGSINPSFCAASSRWLAQVFQEGGSCTVDACNDDGCTTFECDPAQGCAIHDDGTGPCGYETTLSPG